jgi:hypothetical protein
MSFMMLIDEKVRKGKKYQVQDHNHPHTRGDNAKYGAMPITIRAMGHDAPWLQGHRLSR